MKVAIIGTGYVGLTTGTCLAEIGHEVICIDNNLSKIEKLKQGKSPIFEPGLEDLIVKNSKSGRLTFDHNIESATKKSDVIFICVNTPPRGDGHADLRFVEAVAREIASTLDGEYKVIVDKSTVPVRTAEKVKDTISRYTNASTKFDVISNPEFLREGRAVLDTMEPDRIVIGSDSERATKVMLELYQPIIQKTNVPVKIVSVRSAELIKHGANTFLANKISFANLIAETCEAAGADAIEVLDAIGLDQRIGSQFLNPGIGFGGSCFPKDIAAYKNALTVLGIDNALISAVENINLRAWQQFVKKIERELWVLDGKAITVLGLAFKPNTDDVRNSPALKIIAALKAEGAKIRAHDPQAQASAAQIAPDIEYVSDVYDAIAGAEALVICTEWDLYKNLDLQKVKASMATPIIFDGRNIFSPATAQSAGFRYFGVGR